ncbi:MAG: response regulator [Polyangiaceae bacterium]|nr:response regulator [Polyangiaceae bacterium]
MVVARPDIAQQNAQNGLTRGSTRRKVLVVDSDALLLRVLEHGLANLGFDVIAAGSASTALWLVQASSLQLGVMVTDSYMPRMSGLDLASAVRQIDPSIRIILHSSLPSDADADVDAVVHKPARLSALASSITTLLRTGNTDKKQSLH